MTDSIDQNYEAWAIDHQLNSSSPTTRQLYEYRTLTVQGYISQFRRASLNAILPTEAISLTVEQALKVGRVGNVNLRKLLTDNREKFRKR